MLGLDSAGKTSELKNKCLKRNITNHSSHSIQIEIKQNVSIDIKPLMNYNLMTQ